MKIAFISPMAISIKLFRKSLILALLAQGHEVYCFASDFSVKDKQLIESWGAVAVDYKLDARGINPFKDILATIELAKKLQSLRPDIVFPFFVKPVIFATIAARLAKVPRVVGMIEGLGNAFTASQNGLSKKAKLIQKIQVLLYKISLPKLDTLVVLNPDDKADLLDSYDISVKNTVVLGAIGVNLADYPYTPVSTKQPIAFIFIARLLREKGVFEYLQAAEQIKQNYPQAVFYMLGSLDLQHPSALSKEELTQCLEKDIVVYPGHVDDVPAWIAKSSVFVLPSYREGFPRSTQEAMAVGRPIITTDVAGCRETVVDGVNGFLVPPFSSPALAEKMRFFIENPDNIAKMGLASRKMAEQHFDVNNINKRLIKIITGDL